MDVLHVTANLNGGAGIATYRLHRGLRRIQVNSRMVIGSPVQETNDIEGLNGSFQKKRKDIRCRLSRFPLKLYPARNTGKSFSANYLPSRTVYEIQRHDPDLVHLHWINQEYLRIEDIRRISAPVVWTFHDMWPFTGGCHFSFGCDGYQKQCGSCPLLGSEDVNDLSHDVLSRKLRAWSDQEFQVITPSDWLRNRAKQSVLSNVFQLTTIPNGLDLNEFQPRTADKTSTTPEILFGAQSISDPRKGIKYLLRALRRFREQNGSGYRVKMFGQSDDLDAISVPYPCDQVGYVESNEELSTVYSSADVMVVPSSYESFGQTASEALACGTPVVTFDTSGLAEVVDHQTNGYLAEPFEPADLADGIAWVLQDADGEELSDQARAKAVRCFDLNKQAKQVKDVYESVLTP